MEDLTNRRAIPNIVDQMLKIETEIEQVKSGELKERQAQHVIRQRGLMMRGFEMVIAAARLDPRMRNDMVRSLGIAEPVQKAIETTKVAEPKKDDGAQSTAA